jgi:hypothetical protein
MPSGTARSGKRVHEHDGRGLTEDILQNAHWVEMLTNTARRVNPYRGSSGDSGSKFP